jgi:hypothetical protein
MWKLDLDGFYFKIYDERKNVAGYFAPEYGNIYPEDRAEEVIEQMHKKHEKIKSGYLMLPMIKFGILEEGRVMNFNYLHQQLMDIKKRLSLWEGFVTNNGIKSHKITVSHTDHDMLSITFELVFSAPVMLEKNTILKELTHTLDSLQSIGLL